MKSNVLYKGVYCSLQRTVESGSNLMKERRRMPQRSSTGIFVFLKAAGNLCQSLHSSGFRRFLWYFETKLAKRTALISIKAVCHWNAAVIVSLYTYMIVCSKGFMISGPLIFIFMIFSSASDDLHGWIINSCQWMTNAYVAPTVSIV